MDTTWADSLMRMPPVVPLLPPPGDTTARPDSVTAPRVPTGFTVSFAALLDQKKARDMAEAIRVDGRTAHVVPAVREGATIFRVVLGPYSTRADAERAGKTSGRPYWVYEGPP
jgi:cell division septation protein DedD